MAKNTKPLEELIANAKQVVEKTMGQTREHWITISILFRR